MAKAVRNNTLPPIRPNAGTEARYRRALIKLVGQMVASVEYWLSAAYKANPPVDATLNAALAQDETPSMELRRAVRKLARRWQRNFDKAAPQLADYFATAADKRSSEQLKRILKDGGFSVKFRMTRASRDALNASINEQVSLIKSIPQKYFTDVEGAVMRSAATGRDLHALTKEIGGLVDLGRIRMGRKPGESDKSLAARTARRAAFIARDQNNKATAVMTRVRQQEAGITEAIWVHSGGGKEPRPTHLAAGKRGQKYDVAKGWLDPAVDKFIQPGELPNCRCVSRPVIPGF